MNVKYRNIILLWCLDSFVKSGAFTGLQELQAVHPKESLFPLVFFQQASADLEHSAPPGRSRHLLSALLAGGLREVAPDHLAGPDPLQQLLCFLQTSTGPPGAGESLLLLCQPRD